MLVVVLADTHVPDHRARPALPQAVIEAVAAADLVLHAGDVTGAGLLDELAALTPTVAVLGNNDADLVGRLPERIELDLDGVGVAMVHDSGPATGRGARLERWFPGAQLVVFGHSHLPELETDPDGRTRFNPGSPTQRRRAPWPSYGVLRIEDGAVVELTHRRLD